MSICEHVPTKDRTLINTNARFVYLINTINISEAYWIDNTTVQTSLTTWLLWPTLHTTQSELRVKNCILILTMEFPARKYTAQLNCRRPNNSPKEIQHFYPTQPGPALMFLLQNFIFSGLM